MKQDPLELDEVSAQNPSVVKEFREKLKQHVDGGWPVTKGTFATVLS